MAKTFLRSCATATVFAAALSLATATVGSAAPRWGEGAAIGAGTAGFALGSAAAAAAASPYYGSGYYDYAPGPAYTSPYDGTPYSDVAPDWNWSYPYGPAYAPGCGAGRPHC